MTNDELRDLFNKGLNRHGYGFQARVLHEVSELYEKGQSAFVLETIEFPTSVHGSSTRVDILLSRGLGRGMPDFLLAECKRVNPAMANWCFARYPLTRRNSAGTYEPVIMESVRWASGPYNPVGVQRGFTENAAHIGIEVRTKQTGDSGGDSGRAIEEACSQILRGMNGFVESLEVNRQICGSFHGAYLLPVIFTTADLWITDVDLSSADLRTGNLDLKSSDFKSVPWLCYQYHQSPGIVHSLPKVGRSAAITKLMEEDYIRTIPIVSPTGIAQFMHWASNI